MSDARQLQPGDDSERSSWFARDRSLYRRSYLISLGLIGIVALGNWGLSQAMLRSAVYDAKLVDIAGRQRMLSQRISKAAILLETSSGDSEPVVDSEQVMDELEQSPTTRLPSINASSKCSGTHQKNSPGNGEN